MLLGFHLNAQNLTCSKSTHVSGKRECLICVEALFENEGTVRPWNLVGKVILQIIFKLLDSQGDPLTRVFKVPRWECKSLCKPGFDAVICDRASEKGPSGHKIHHIT